MKASFLTKANSDPISHTKACNEPPPYPKCPGAGSHQLGEISRATRDPPSGKCPFSQLFRWQLPALSPLGSRYLQGTLLKCRFFFFFCLYSFSVSLASCVYLAPLVVNTFLGTEHTDVSEVRPLIQGTYSVRGL